MRKPPPEFSRPLRVDRVPPAGSIERISAEPRELVDVARRLGLPAVESLSAVYHVEPARGHGLRVTGEVKARLGQVCVVSLEQFESDASFRVERYFLPASAIVHDDGEGEDEEVDPIEHGEIDLGEITTETLALSLDPYPRKPGAVFETQEFASPEQTPPEGSQVFSELLTLRNRFRDE